MPRPAGNEKPSPRTRATVRDIARELGIHFTTVAAALRDSPRVKEATKQQVRSTAERLGYHADPVLSALSSYRSKQGKAKSQGVLAWMHGSESDFLESLQPNFYRDCFEGSQKRARELGFQLEPFSLKDANAAPGDTAEALLKRNVTGLIVGPLPFAMEILSFPWDRFRVVRIGYSLRSLDVTSVAPDHFSNTRLVFDKLAQLGHQRIGFCCEKAFDERTNNQWLGGYLAAQQFHQTLPQLPPFLWSQDSDSLPFRDWLRAHRPDALITEGQPFCEEALKEARETLDLTPSLASLRADSARLDLPGASQNGRRIGSSSVDHLVGIIHRHAIGLSVPPQIVTVRGKWQDAPAPPSS